MLCSVSAKFIFGTLKGHLFFSWRLRINIILNNIHPCQTEFSSFNAEYIKEEPIEGAEYFFPEADTKELSEFKELNSKNLVKEKILSGR